MASTTFIIGGHNPSEYINSISAPLQAQVTIEGDTF